MVVTLEDVLTPGGVFTGVVQISELGGMGSFAGITLIHRKRVAVFLDPGTDLQPIRRVTLVRFAVIEYDQGFKLVCGQDAHFFLHQEFDPSRLLRIREACSGLGGLGQGGKLLGMQVTVQNEIQPRTATIAQGISGACMVEGDINSLSTVVSMWQADPGDSVFASGFSCQPYSRLGDRKSGADARADSFTGSLRAAFLLQTSAIVLECVQPVLDDSFVQGCLSDFVDRTGYHLQQCVLELHQVWSANRSRWWALLTAPHVGQVPVTLWKPHGPWHAVEDVVEVFNATPAECSQLALRADEEEAFQELRPLSDYCLRRNKPLPTALHSWGSVLDSCPCGCR